MEKPARVRRLEAKKLDKKLDLAFSQYCKENDYVGTFFKRMKFSSNSKLEYILSFNEDPLKSLRQAAEHIENNISLCIVILQESNTNKYSRATLEEFFGKLEYAKDYTFAQKKQAFGIKIDPTKKVFKNTMTTLLQLDFLARLYTEDK